MQTYLSKLNLRMEKIEKKNCFIHFFYLEIVILITNELQLRDPVLQTILYLYTDCIRQYKFRRFKNLKTSLRLKTLFLGWGGGGVRGGTSSLSLSFRLEVPPPLFFWPHRQCAFMIVIFDLTFASLALGVVSKTGNLFDFLKLNLVF